MIKQAREVNAQTDVIPGRYPVELYKNPSRDIAHELGRNIRGVILLPNGDLWLWKDDEEERLELEHNYVIKHKQWSNLIPIILTYPNKVELSTWTFDRYLSVDPYDIILNNKHLIDIGYTKLVGRNLMKVKKASLKVTN